MKLVTLKEWTDALRSGKFKQGRRATKQTDVIDPTPDDYTYCCLGVLAEISGADEDGELIIPDDWNELLTHWGVGFLQSELVRLNDSAEFSFNQIADYLEGKDIQNEK